MENISCSFRLSCLCDLVNQIRPNGLELSTDVVRNYNDLEEMIKCIYEINLENVL